MEIFNIIGIVSLIIIFACNIQMYRIATKNIKKANAYKSVLVNTIRYIWLCDECFSTDLKTSGIFLDKMQEQLDKQGITDVRTKRFK